MAELMISLPTKMNHVKTLPKAGKGAVCIQYRRCGKPNCGCARGSLHGPYYCLFWREQGRLRKHYLRPEDVGAFRSECEARRKRAADQRRLHELWRQRYSAYLDTVRQVGRP